MRLASWCQEKMTFRESLGTTEGSQKPVLELAIDFIQPWTDEAETYRTVSAL